MADVLISRRFDFSASHRYYREEWSEEENERVFGLCALPNGHGHNYTLEVPGAGSRDRDTGMVINLVDLRARWLVDPAGFLSLGRNCPFKGRRLQGRVVGVVAGRHLRRFTMWWR